MERMEERAKGDILGFGRRSKGFGPMYMHTQGTLPACPGPGGARYGLTREKERTQEPSFFSRLSPSPMLERGADGVV